MIAPRWRPPLAWAAVILVLTSIPVPSTPVDDVLGLDKLVHLVLYGVLGALAARAARTPSRARLPLLAALGAVILFAAADEWHQALVPGRSADPLDWVADAVGALAGTALVVRGLLRSERYT